MDNETLVNAAIKAALNNNWPKAKKLNLLILKNNPKDLEALLRLAKTYKEIGQNKLAQKTYRQVIKLDRFNAIAKRELLNLKKLKAKKKKTKSKLLFDADLFLEEPGKTKTVALIKLNNEKVLLSLNPAEEVKLVVGKKSITVRDKQNCYLGRLPDDLSLRLIRLINRGNKYLAVAKDISKDKLAIFIKEIKRSKKNINLPSFLNTNSQPHNLLPFS